MRPERHNSKGWAPRGAARAIAAVAALAVLLAACGGGAAPTATRVTLPSGAAAPTVTVAAAAVAPTATARPAATATIAPAPRVATPAGSPTPIPSPAPGIGAAIAAQGWEITVRDVTTYQRIGDNAANGVYVYVSLSVTNTGAAPAAFPYDGLVVLDANGVTYPIDVPATKETLTYDKRVDFFAQLQPGAAQDVAAAFDVPVDVTGLKLTTPSRVFTIVLDYTAGPK